MYVCMHALSVSKYIYAFLMATTLCAYVYSYTCICEGLNFRREKFSLVQILFCSVLIIYHIKEIIIYIVFTNSIFPIKKKNQATISKKYFKRKK